MDAAESGGMAAVCETEHFAERIAANGSNRSRILSVAVPDFLRTFTHWRKYFLDDADKPVIGATAAQLQSITVPTCIVPGNDRTHSHPIGDAAHRLIAGSELHDLFPGDTDVDLVPPE